MHCRASPGKTFRAHGQDPEKVQIHRPQTAVGAQDQAAQRTEAEIPRQDRISLEIHKEKIAEAAARSASRPARKKQPARRPASRKDAHAAVPAKERITPALVAEHGLKPDEYQRILELIGREPTLTELGIFSAMWNEHCSYKSSKIHLRTLPTKAPWVIQGPGENAGVIDIGDGLACVFKMESHNHPSYIEPYQGAATGVGGILRDVFTMGARPIACLNALSFGAPEHPQDPPSRLRRGRRHRRLRQFASACRRSAARSVSTPATTATSWSTPWRSASPRPTRSSTRRRPASACRSSISAPRPAATASTAPRMASAEFDEDSEEKRPTVQVGDPFSEKLLLEACLEIMAKDCVIAIQDMGAAGLTCSAVEMGAKGDLGVDPRSRQGAVPRRPA